MAMRGATPLLMFLALAGCTRAEPESKPDFEPYRQQIGDSELGFDMTPIPGGRFTMGCRADESGAAGGESPPHQVELSPFWIGTHEVRWDEYRLYQFDLLPEVDGVTGPTPPYVPMDSGMGVESFPAVAMTHYAARQYCKWLSLQSGVFYRLPTEAEWEYACRAGTDTAYSFADDALDEHAWHYANAEEGYRVGGTRAANGFGLYDMHGNVAEWVMDGYDAETYSRRAAAGEVVIDPVVWPTEEWGRVVRGGSWDDDPERLRSAARRSSRPEWKMLDPQRPRSIWYLTNAPWLGMRLVRPLNPPPPEEWARWWDAELPHIIQIQDRQARGER